MEDFAVRYGVCIILCGVGLFFVVMTYCAYFADRSGVPFVGGFFIAIGFLTSPVKWLAVVGLIDSGYWSIPYFLILDHIREKKFAAVYSEHEYAEQIRDTEKRLRIWIPERNEELFRSYITRHIYELRIPKLLFAVCMDKIGRRFMLVDRCVRSGSIEILELEEEKIILTGLRSKKGDMTVEIEIVEDMD